MKDGIGVGFALAWGVLLLLSSCHTGNAIREICREEHSILKDYEKCVDETEYFRDLKYSRKKIK
jgi:hypothetical protein